MRSRAPSQDVVDDWRKQAAKAAPEHRRLLNANSKYWKAWFQARKQEKDDAPSLSILD